MTDADFLDAIAAAPEDDLPRRAYADWLEENGQGERAEFIRLQLIFGGCRSFGYSPLG